MLVTEKEAADIWCSEARVMLVTADRKISAPISFNRIAVIGTTDFELPSAANCIGPRCMKWEWIDQEGIPERRGVCGLVRK